MSIKAYTSTLKRTEEPRQIERRLLSRATASLEQFQELYDSADKPGRARLLTAEMKDVLWLNQRIWMALKADLALPDNEMPTEIRARLLSLAIWVGRQTQAVLGGGGAIRPLIEINRNIIAGLEAAVRPSLVTEGS